MTEGDFEFTFGEGILHCDTPLDTASERVVCRWMEQVVRNRVMACLGDPSNPDDLVPVPIKRVTFHVAPTPGSIMAVIDFERAPRAGRFSFVSFDLTDAWLVSEGDWVRLQQEFRVTR